MDVQSAVWWITYRLKKDAAVEAFLLASRRCHDEVLSQQKGFLSWDVLRDGETWIDLVRWETVEDAKRAETAGAGEPAAKAFYAFINMNSCRLQLCTVERSHGAAAGMG